MGVSYLHPATKFEFFGAIADLWLGEDGEYLVVDYKATAKKDEVNLDADWQISYKRQMEIYQWLLRKHGLPISNRGWFVYCNGKGDLTRFDNKVEFRVSLLPYDGNDDWVETALIEAKETLNRGDLPSPDENCDFCTYRQETAVFE